MKRIITIQKNNISQNEKMYKKIWVSVQSTTTATNWSCLFVWIELLRWHLHITHQCIPFIPSIHSFFGITLIAIVVAHFARFVIIMPSFVIINFRRFLLHCRRRRHRLVVVAPTDSRAPCVVSTVDGCPAPRHVHPESQQLGRHFVRC